MRFKTSIIISLLSLLIPTSGFAAKDRPLDVERVVHSMDSMLKERPKNVANHKNKIEELTRRYEISTDAVERMYLSRLLFEAYESFDTDSALKYAYEIRDLIIKNHPDNKDLRDENDLAIINTLIMGGKFEGAQRKLNAINPEELSPDNRAYYYEVKEHNANTIAVYISSENTDWDELKSEINSYRDSIIGIDVATPERWLWVPLAKKIDANNSDSLAADDPDAAAIIRYMQEHPEDSELNAVNAYWLFRFYNKIGDEQNELKYLVKGALMNERLLNRELVTLQDLASFLFVRGYNTKAYEYMESAILNAEALKDRSRIVDVLSRVVKFGHYYREEKSKSDRRIKGLVIALSIIVFVLLVAIWVDVYALIKLRKTKILLQHANSKLHLDNDSLKHSVEENSETITRMDKKNERLTDLLGKKDDLIGLCVRDATDAFHFLEEYRKKLLKAFRTKDSKELGILINNPELLKEIYQDFYKNFDHTLITAFPDFIDSYNNSVLAEFQVDKEQIIKKKKLNTRMRIFALAQIGIEKSSDVARILNISPQTVYNAKSELLKEN